MFAFVPSTGRESQNCPMSRTTALARTRPAAAGTKEMEPGVARRAVEPGRDTPGSISFVPAAAGLVLASAVVRELGEF